MSQVGPREDQASAARADAELARAARAGDKRAFVEIVARHQALVAGIAYGILNDFSASEDAAQEAFLTAWRKIQELRELERLRPWLAQIARNAALGHLRRQRPVARLEVALDRADEAPVPDQSAATEEEAELVREALAELPELYRLPLVLFYREGQSVRAVAEALSISEDATKQRLARGREMLRERLSGVIERVLTRQVPGPVFTMTIAAAIGALASPATLAGTVFASAAAASAATASTTTMAPAVTAMSTSKSLVAAAAVFAAISIPVGYHLAERGEPVASEVAGEAAWERVAPAERARPSFESSALFGEWIALHEKHGTNAAAMPVLFKAIEELEDQFRRRAFHTALVAEWALVDPAAGLRFFMEKGRESALRDQFFREWLEHDPHGAVTTLLTTSGWESLGRQTLKEIARKAPELVPTVAARLPASDSYWDRQVQEAFALVAQSDLENTPRAAEELSGPNRSQALAGVAEVWAKSDWDSALKWVKELPDGVDRDEILRCALIGQAAVDPVAALDKLGLVPSGGRAAHAVTTTAGRVLQKAAEVDFESTVAWIARNQGRLSREDIRGMAESVKNRLNADAIGFLTKHSNDNSLAALKPAIDSALLNRAGGQRETVWKWLKEQPESDFISNLREDVMRSAAWQDPELAARFVKDFPAGEQGEKLKRELARSMFNGESSPQELDRLREMVSDSIKPYVVEQAFAHISEKSDPAGWIERLELLPENSRAEAIQSIARGWARRNPEEAFSWAKTLPDEEIRASSIRTVADTYARNDLQGAAGWIASLPATRERDVCAEGLVYQMAAKFPHEAWRWSLSISDQLLRERAAIFTVQRISDRDPETARRWLNEGPIAPELREKLQPKGTAQ